MNLHPRGLTESPIEELFFKAFHAVAALDEHQYRVVPCWDHVHDLYGNAIVMRPQATIGKFRVDFLIEFGGKTMSIVVECDGHDFHEKTEQQVSRDNQRDRTLQKWSYKVFRFTGSDLNRDSFGCARDVLEAFMDFQTGVIVAAHKTACDNERPAPCHE